MVIELFFSRGQQSAFADPRPNFTSTYRGVNAHLAYCLNSVLNVKALVGAFSVIVQLHKENTTTPINRLQHWLQMLQADLAECCRDSAPN